MRHRVPLSAVRLIGVIDADIERRVTSTLQGIAGPPPIRIRRDWYY